jgi:translation initiation factor IF-2
MLNDIKDELTKRVPSTDEDVQTGSADVLQTFEITDRNKKIPVAGCRVTDGSFEKKQLFKLIRNGQVIHRGEILFCYHKSVFIFVCFSFLERYFIIFKTCP